MERSTKDDWLSGPADIQEADVEDVPVPGRSIRVRGLPAAFSNRATSEAMIVAEGRRGERTGKLDMARMEVIQFAHGCVEPQFSEEDAAVVAQRFGPAFKKVIAEIDRLSGTDKATISQTEATFPAGGGAPAGEVVGADAANGRG